MSIDYVSFSPCEATIRARSEGREKQKERETIREGQGVESGSQTSVCVGDFAKGPQKQSCVECRGFGAMLSKADQGRMQSPAGTLRVHPAPTAEQEMARDRAR